MNAPEVRYADSAGGQVAYQVLGEGPLDVVTTLGWASNLETIWDGPHAAAFLERLATFARVIVLDPRGVGLSDPIEITETSPAAWMDDVLSVMDAAGTSQAAVLGQEVSALMFMLFAASFPERTRGLVVLNGYARLSRAPDYPWGFPPDFVDQIWLPGIADGWGTGISMDAMAPSAAGDPSARRWMARMERVAASPRRAVAIQRAVLEMDVRDILPSIRVPTLVLHSADNRMIRPAHGRFLAERIPDARFVDLPGTDQLTWIWENPGGVAEEIQAFLTGSRPVPEPDRVLATVLFVDVVGSTERAAELGDRTWRGLLERYYRVVRDELDTYRGREIKTIGDGFLATFDGPARAIRCADAVRSAVIPLGIQTTAGLHTGEIELMDDDVGGIGVHIAARVIGKAGPGEVVVSSTVKDLVAGSGIEFEERGTHELKGVPGEWRLYAVGSA